MLNAVLEKLNALFSSRLIIGGFFPLLIFFSVNGALLWTTSSTFRLIVTAMKPVSTSALTVLAMIGALLIVAGTYAFSALQPWLRETLEGSNWPEWLARKFRPLQYERFVAMRDGMRDAVGRRDNTLLRSKRWLDDLRNARAAGAALSSCKYTHLPPDIEDEVEKVRERIVTHDEVDVASLEMIAAALAEELCQNNAELEDEGSLRLRAEHQHFIDFVERAKSASAIAVTRSYSRFKTNFADDRLAPTAVGNIAATIISYAYGRYRMNVEMLWTRLQKVMQADVSGLAGTVQDSKTQLDFVVGVFWALLLSTIFWILALPLLTHSLALYLAVAIGMPLASTFSYAIVLVSYRAFVDLIRSSVDLYRFALIDALHLHRPPSLTAERKLWNDVDQNMSYGANFDLPYDQSRT